jgi:hypothetical protein
MFKKLTLAALAVGAGLAALPAPAQAEPPWARDGYGHHWGRGHGYGRPFYRPGYRVPPPYYGRPRYYGRPYGYYRPPPYAYAPYR